MMRLPSRHVAAFALLSSACTGEKPGDEALALASLVPSVGVLEPKFSPDQLSYTVRLPSWSPALRFSLSATPADARVEVNGAPVTAGAPSPEVAAALGTTTVAVDVVAAGGARRSYSVSVLRSESQLFYIKASNTGAGDNFGRGVALSGDLLAVGSPLEDSSAAGVNGDQSSNGTQNSGAVYIFRWDGAAWAQEAYLKASDPKAEAQFGTRISLSGDTLAVGTDSAEVAYVFRRSGTSWTQEARLQASNRGVGDAFGRVVAVSGDTLAVAAPGEASAATGVNGDQGDNSAPGSGAVYLFHRSGSEWTQEAYLKSSITAKDLGKAPLFGTRVALDGDTLGVSSVAESKLYVFRRGGGAWAKEADVEVFADTVAATTAIAVSGDAVFIGIGQPSYIYRRKGAAWRKEATFETARNGFAGFLGDLLAVGVNGVDKVQLHRRDGQGAWKSEVTFDPPPGSSTMGSFGGAVSLSSAGIAIGAVFESSNATGIGGDPKNTGAANSGAVYVVR